MTTRQSSSTPADPLIDEVRAISEQFGNDDDKLCDQLQELERQHTERLIQPTAQREA